MGSWTELLAGSAVTEDVWAVQICISSAGSAGIATDCLIDIGIDEAGGTSYTVKIPYLIGSGAAPYNNPGGVWYVFPIRIPAGSSIAARMQCQTASRTARVFVRVLGAPDRPEATRVGMVVTAHGIDATNSRGTVITAGTTSEGSWTQISASTLGEPQWWWQLGHGYDGTIQVAACWSWDIGVGDATNKRLIVDGVLTFTTTNEQTALLRFTGDPAADVSGSDIVYARGQCSGTPAANTSVAVYSVGG